MHTTAAVEGNVRRPHCFGISFIDASIVAQNKTLGFDPPTPIGRYTTIMMCSVSPDDMFSHALEGQSAGKL